MIESHIFYMGNKYELLPQLFHIFPKKIDTFYDLFGGSGVVSLNVKANKIIYNELNKNIYNLFNLPMKYESEEIINHIKTRIKEFNLEKENKQSFEKFRSFYNNSVYKNPLDLYTLTYYSFCNLIRFNQKNEFNMPVGNQYFSDFKHKIKIQNVYYKKTI